MSAVEASREALLAPGGFRRRRFRIIALVIVLAVTCVPIVRAADTGFALRLVPGVTLPIADSADYFTLGASVDFLADYRLPALPLIGVRLGLGYQFLPIWTGDSAQLLSIAAGPTFSVDLGSFFESSIYGIAGYYRGFLVDGSGISGGNAYLQGGVRASFEVTPKVLIELDLNYRNNLQFSQSVSASLGASYRFLPGRPLELRDVNFQSVFPVLFKYYDESPIGTATLYNPASVAAEDVTVDVFVQEFMINPRRAEAPTMLKPGEEVSVDLYALFADDVLQVTHGTRVSAQITTSYTMDGRTRVDEVSATLTILDRNALTWDDDRKVLQFARGVAAWAAQQGYALNSNLQKAMAIMEALRLHGVTYVIDPETPYAELSGTTETVDFLQFPQQTLRFTAGDCDDLCILYSAMLESVGVETAFVTTPRHISLAFSLGVAPDEARRTFRDADDLIYIGDKVWMPIEVTAMQSGFDRARTEGARRFRQYDAAGEVGFHPTHEAWAVYEPVGFSEEGVAIAQPDRELVVAAFDAEMERFIDREIFDRVTQLERRIADRGGSPRDHNRLGVLFARYGRVADARAQFEKVIEIDPNDASAMVNIGNLLLLEGRPEEAEQRFTVALELDPERAEAMLGLARSAWEIGDFSAVRRWYNEVSLRAPTIAERYQFLDLDAGGSPAAGQVTNESLLWDEE